MTNRLMPITPTWPTIPPTLNSCSNNAASAANASGTKKCFRSRWRVIYPPMCNPEDLHLLLDGVYVNNLPADVMRNIYGPGTIFAVDIGGEEKLASTNYGDYLSGFWILWNKIWPFGESMKVPGMGDIQSHLGYVSCVRQLEIVKDAPYCHYLKPPLDSVRTRDFNLFKQVYEIGYKYGKECCDGWLKNGKLEEIFSSQVIAGREEEQNWTIQFQLMRIILTLSQMLFKITTKMHKWLVIKKAEDSVPEREFFLCKL